MNKKKKTYKTFIKDLVFNNPRADKQSPIGKHSKNVMDRMLYDKTMVKNKTSYVSHKQ